MNRNYWIYWLIIFAIVVLYLLFSHTPFFYQIIFGNKVIDNQINKLHLNDYNCYEKAQILNQWLKIEINDANRNLLDKDYNGPRFHPRIDGPYPAWIIIQKYGACGEGAWYLTSMLNKLGCNARTIRKSGWSHLWTEFVDENDTKYYVDPFTLVDSNIYAFINQVKTYGYELPDQNICIWTDTNKKFNARTKEFNPKNVTNEYYAYLKDFRYDTNNCAIG